MSEQPPTRPVPSSGTYGYPPPGTVARAPQSLGDLVGRLRVTPPALTDRAPLRLLSWVVGGGVALELGIRGGVANLVVASGLLTLAGALLTDGRIERRSSRWLVAASMLPALSLAWRASPWLTASNLAAALGLMTVAVLQSRSGDVFDTTVLRLGRRLPEALWRSAWAALVFRGVLPHPGPAGAKRLGQVAIAVAIALPVLGLVVALLAAADPVFAGIVSPDIDVAVAGHVLLAGFFGFGLLMAVAAALGDSDEALPDGTFGVAAVATMLGLAVSVLTLFVLAQLVALTEAGDRLIEDAGLTPAEYARSGFFQLCWATAFLLVFLGVVGWLAAPEVKARRPIRALFAAVPLLTLGLVGVSLRRMALYDEAFGLTMLRLWVVLAAVWMGLVLLLIAARNLGLGGDRRWVLGATIVVSTVLGVGVTAANPEAFVVHHNFDRAAEGMALDLDYLTGLSDDAVPAMVDELGREAFEIEMDRYGRRQAMRCQDDTTGVAALNLAVARAEDVRDEACEPRRTRVPSGLR